MLVAKKEIVITPDRYNVASINDAPFWRSLLSDGALQQCENLEKLLVGCEIIAALDDLHLLAA